MSRITPTLSFLCVMITLGFLTLAPSAHAAGEKVIHSFNGSGNLPFSPMGGVIFDSAGNLYGTTVGGGARNDGAVFELTLGASGRWTAVPVYSLVPPRDGEEPAAGLIFDSAGNLYGTTLFGGLYGQGVVFQLSRGTDGAWKETLLHSFAGGKDGYYPQGPLSIDAAGNVYGTTVFGGLGRACENHGCGTVFQLTPGSGGTWTETVLHIFQNTREDGGYPDGGVTLDAAGNLYGTTELGGAHSSGTVFQLSLVGGTWTENIVHNFCSEANCADGSEPFAGVIFDSSGNLYGTTGNGGTLVGSGCGGAACGTVFQLSPGGGGAWTENVLYNFCSPNCSDGALPGAFSLVFDALGNLYGTTGAGGLHGTNCNPYGCGTVFELSPGVGGAWSESALYSFPPNGLHGLGQRSGVVLDSAGNLYGTTSVGGAYNNGTVFEVTP